MGSISSGIPPGKKLLEVHIWTVSYPLILSMVTATLTADGVMLSALSLARSSALGGATARAVASAITAAITAVAVVPPLPPPRWSLLAVLVVAVVLLRSLTL